LFFFHRVSQQKQYRKAGKLDAMKVTLLNAIGFNFEMDHQSTWQENFDELKQYYEQNGYAAEYGSKGSGRRMYKW